QNVLRKQPSAWCFAVDISKASKWDPFYVLFILEHIVCEDELKYALLANNCLCPGISTFVTLLLHRSLRGREGQDAKESWQKLYGRLSGNQIYSIKVKHSKFFSSYVGRPFVQVSLNCHRKYGICLVAVQEDRSNTTIMLNPGSDYILKETDTCFYMSIIKEENFDWSNMTTKKTFALPTVEELCNSLRPNGPELALRRLATLKGLNTNDNYKQRTFEEEKRNLLNVKSFPLRSTDNQDLDLIVGFPQNPPYIGSFPALCMMLRKPMPLCCLQLIRSCEHGEYSQASDYHWSNSCIIVFASQATSGLFNFILPLRSHMRTKMFLKPIVLLLEERPTNEFLETVNCFPLVYWIQGSITNVDTLLKAGILEAETVVVVNKENNVLTDEESLSDCSTIVAVQSMFRIFPDKTVVAELSKTTNMRFLKFRAKDTYALSMAQNEKEEQAKGSTMSYIFRLPFASGNTRNEIMRMVRRRMVQLGITQNYEQKPIDNEKFAFVLMNPPDELTLQAGDVIYLLKPGRQIQLEINSDNLSRISENSQLLPQGSTDVIDHQLVMDDDKVG
ncbi:unnamed protein product, partial [Didymodactylos carnosus]